MLTEEVVQDLIEILPEKGVVQVRTATIIKKDGQEVSRANHRHVISPDDDYSAETDSVRAVCYALRNPTAIAAYLATSEPSEQALT